MTRMICRSKLTLHATVALEVFRLKRHLGLQEQEAESRQHVCAEVPLCPPPGCVWACKAFPDAATCSAGTGMDLNIEQLPQRVIKRPAMDGRGRQACCSKQPCSIHADAHKLAMLRRQQQHTWRQYCHSQQTSAQLLGRHMPWSMGIRRFPSTRMLPALRSAGSRRQLSSSGGSNSSREEHVGVHHAVQDQDSTGLCLAAIKQGK